MRTGLFVAGILLSSMVLVLRHYFTMHDFVDGLLCGGGIGLMILSLILLSKEKNRKAVNC